MTKATPAFEKRGEFFIPIENPAFDLAPAENGDVFLASSYRDSVVIAGKTYGKDTAGFPDFFVARLSGTGEVRWFRFGSCRGEIVKVEYRNALVHVVGNTRREFGMEGEDTVPAGSQNAFVLKLDPEGSRKDLVLAGGEGYFTVRDFDMDKKGNFYFGGDYNGANALPGLQLDFHKETDVLAFKTDSRDRILGHWTIGGDWPDNGYSIRVDSSGNAYFSGRTIGKAAKGALVLESTSANFFLIKFGPDFEPLWSVKTFGTGHAEGEQILLQNSKEILVTGSFAGSVNFGTGPLSGGDRLNCHDIRDPYLLNLDEEGKVRSVEQFGGTYEDFGQGVATIGRDIYVINSVGFGKEDELGPQAVLVKAKSQAVFSSTSVRDRPRPRMDMAPGRGIPEIHRMDGRRLEISNYSKPRNMLKESKGNKVLQR